MIEKDGLIFYDGLSSGCIAVESDKIEKYIKYIQKNEVKDVSLSYKHYRADNIDFLALCPFVEELSITSSTINNYKGLENLSALKKLSFDEPKGIIDLSQHTSIEELIIEFNKNVIGLENMKNLKVLRIWKYNPKSKNLLGLSSLMSLEELTITQSNINSLTGISAMTKLKKIVLNYLTKLEYIDEIDNNLNRLTELDFNYCKNLKNHEYVSSLTNLEELGFNDCKEIPSIRFIGNMKSLKKFTFVNTNVLDGDLSACTNLEYVGFLDKKHYSHKRKDFVV